MPRPIDYPTLAEVIALHGILIAEHGGELGIRDRGLIESAILRPQTGYYDGLFQEAAAIMQSLALNHGFVDGNKRIAFAACAMFLDLNKVKLDVTVRQAKYFVVECVVNKRYLIESIAEWLESHVA